MLQRPLQNALRRLPVPSFPRPCVICQCACGRPFSPQINHVSGRNAASKSPAVQHKERDLKQRRRASVGREDLASRLLGLDQNILRNFLTPYMGTYVGLELDTGVNFLVDLAEELVRGNYVARTVGPQRFEDLLTKHALSNDETLAKLSGALKTAKNEDYELLAQALLYSAAYAGGERAILTIMYRAMQQNKRTPGTLTSVEARRVHAKLIELADSGTNYFAAVLAGKIALELHDKKTAESYLKRALGSAVLESEATKSRRARDGRRFGRDRRDEMDGFLSSPWVELHSIYIDNRDWDKARWAIYIGCEQDDPNSHYAASFFEKETIGEETVHRSGWFYHITKAASSGHVRAMHELGLWYAQEGWPYIKDEPPDHIKPTPFDRYPPPTFGNTLSLDTLSSRLTTALGLGETVSEDIYTQTFHTAAYPATPKERYAMALKWLETAMGFNYAPSFLAAAQLHLEKTLWPEASTLEEAIELKTSRYTYASKATYEANKPLEKSVPKVEEALPNPYYDPERAKTYTREIFYAARSLRVRMHEIQMYMSNLKRGSEASQHEAAAERDLPSDMGPNMTKWHRFPQVRELFMNERTGKLFDMERNNVDLLEEAQLLCEDQEWDIYGEDGDLFYRHGMKKA